MRTSKPLWDQLPHELRGWGEDFIWFSLHSIWNDSGESVVQLGLLQHWLRCLDTFSHQKGSHSILLQWYSSILVHERFKSERRDNQKTRCSQNRFHTWRIVSPRGCNCTWNVDRWWELRVVRILDIISRILDFLFLVFFCRSSWVPWTQLLFDTQSLSIPFTCEQVVCCVSNQFV